MPTISKILVPVDFSEGSRKALRQAASLAEAFETELTVLHVWEPPLYVFPEVMVQVPGERNQSLEEYARVRADEEMEKFIADNLQPPLSERVQTRVECGHPFQAIVDVAKDGGFDLIVMGTHGRRGLPHLLIGSIAEKVVRQAPCPVLTVRDPELVAHE
jgi:nucleotide-binding universal stress UspA family protein